MKKQSIKNRNMFLIEWFDARFFSGTYIKKDAKKHNMCRFKSLGYIVSKDKTTTRIGAERNNVGEYRDITLIPTGSIISIKKLEIVRTRRN